MDQTVKGFDIYDNGRFIGFIEGRSLKARQIAARRLVISTHMGQWIKKNECYEYATTIGVYLTFQPVKRLAAVVGNYRIDTEE